ncbi:lipopolysaccharide assembly protein LapA domain-containing protein [Lysobacter brunescens]|uniref:Lipopolysaccharide assembly protein LapA domain-containing protein n=1 Tax=Lysobacter brunescens TaxID=262323 RepID=A0ABW2YIF5_9GAMM
MRPLRAFIALLFLALGVVVGALNPGVIAVDLGFWRIEAALGVLLLAAVLCGVLLGGLAMVVAVVMPLRRELRRASPPGEIAVPAASTTPSPVVASLSSSEP